MNVLDLFSGIGGFSLGLERSGMRTVAFCEKDALCQAVLKKHWPDIPVIGDIRGAVFPSADIICGGFPCQDISRAGLGAGIAGERSGLWREMVRAIRLVRPLYAIVENVAELFSRGMGTVLGDLAENGYDAQWDCISADDIGLPHARERVWIVAHSNGARELQPGWGITKERRWRSDKGKATDWVLSRGGILRSDDGIPASLDRIGAVGNAIVPQIPEIIGQAIMNMHGRTA